MTILGDWGWNVKSPKQKVQPMNYFPKVAVAELNIPMTDSFLAAFGEMEMQVDAHRPELVRFLVWNKAECDLLVDTFACHQKELPMDWTSLDFSAEMPVEMKSLNFVDLDNLEVFTKPGFATHARVLTPEQIADQPHEGAVKPKVFFYGDTLHMPAAFIGTFFDRRRRNPDFQTYGYGPDPDMYDHWYSADSSYELIVRNRTETEHCFDMVITTIVTDFVGFMDSVVRDQKKDIEWADSKLRPGGLFVLYAKASSLKYHLGTLVNRFTDFSVTYPSPGFVVVMATKKVERSRDDATRDALEEVLSFEGGQWLRPNASLITAGIERVYTVAGDPKLDPAIFTRWMGKEYIARFCTEYPFSPLSAIFKRAEKAEVTRLVTTPSVTQLTKLRLRGIIKGQDGEVIVTKQTDETITTEKTEVDYDEDGEEKAVRRIVRTRKRVMQVSLVLRDPVRNLDNNPLRKGDSIQVDAA